MTSKENKGEKRIPVVLPSSPHPIAPSSTPPCIHQHLLSSPVCAFQFQRDARAFSTTQSQQQEEKQQEEQEQEEQERPLLSSPSHHFEGERKDLIK